jgi:hypothetical protein
LILEKSTRSGALPNAGFVINLKTPEARQPTQRALLSAAYGNKAYENKSARRLEDWDLSHLAEQEKQCGN